MEEENVKSFKKMRLIIVLLSIIIIMIFVLIFFLEIKENNSEVIDNNNVEIKNKKNNNKEVYKDTTVDSRFDVLNEISRPNTGETISKIVIMNGKEISIVASNKNGIELDFKVNNNIIWDLSHIAPYNYRYSIIKGNDNIDYLLLVFKSFEDYGYIVNDEGKILFELSSYADELKCFALFDGIRNLYIRDGIVYYYKYRTGSRTRNEKIYEDLYKIVINNNEVKEEKTEMEITLPYGQCS